MSNYKSCNHCGATIPAESIFCEICGQRLGSAPTGPQSYEPVTRPYESPPSPPARAPPPAQPKRHTDKRLLLAVGGVAIALIILVAAVIGPAISSITGQHPSESQSVEPVTGVGKTASNSQLSITATYQGVYVEDNQYLQPQAGNKYVKFYVTLTNINSPSGYLGQQDFTLLDSQNTEHTPATTSYGDAGLKALENSSQGQTTSGTIIFEIPNSTTPMTLAFEDVYHEKLSINF